MKTMHGVHLASLDLNLLVALDALLAERHVTRAAARVRLSQSAMSHALARIRDAFGDPILVRTNEGMVPTERALAVEPLLRRALGELSRALGGATFDPRTSERSFTLGTTDYGELLFLPGLVERLRRDAPGIDVVVKPLPVDWVGALGVGEFDVVLAPAHMPAYARGRDAPGIAHEPLLDERFRCVVRRGHPLAKQRLTIARYVAWPHVLIAPRGIPGSFVDDALAALGKRRRVACMVPHFMVAPHIVARTDLVLTTTERLAKHHLRELDLVERPVPLAIPTFRLSLLWHERSTREPGHAWLRGVLREIAGSA